MEAALNGCRKYEDLIARYQDGESLLQDREELEGHLRICPGCRKLHRDTSDMDLALREYHAKRIDPPAHLHSRILANLPEAAPLPWARWWRLGLGLGTAAVMLLAVVVALHRGDRPRVGPVASAPAPASPETSPGPTGATSPSRSAETGKLPVIKSAPGGERKGGTIVASAPKVQVIKEVKIFFYYPPAQKVTVTGDFNDWDAAGVPMKAAGKPGLWETELRLPPGVYSYSFIVDGELLVPDPNSPNQMPDGYGGTNSLLLVKGENSI